MTIIYDTYYSNIQSGNIDLKAVNFSAYVVDATYVPNPTHKKSQITGKIETLVQILVGGDISTLTMAEIVEKVVAELSEEERNKAAAFVVYDIGTQQLCFCETLDLMFNGRL